MATRQLLKRIARTGGIGLLVLAVCSSSATGQDRLPSGQRNVRSSATQTSSGPTIILHNANVLTMDTSTPRAEAVAIEGNRIVAVGLNDEILGLQTASTQLYDLDGRTVLPGLIDDHGHRLLHAYWEGGPEGLIRATREMAADGGSVGFPSISTVYQSGGGAGTHGDLFKPPEEMNAAVAEVIAAGYPTAMHALGDSAVGVGLNAFQAAFAGGGNTLRSRMTHVRVMREDLADQMAASGADWQEPVPLKYHQKN